MKRIVVVEEIEYIYIYIYIYYDYIYYHAHRKEVTHNMGGRLFRMIEALEKRHDPWEQCVGQCMKCWARRTI
jgi:hypothetical protein